MPQLTLGKPLHEIPDGLFGQNLEIGPYETAFVVVA